ncbi:hypothetical protein Rhopal_000495-T1 [Rhodotorula paludigena]|uniref:ER-bound oxygenase mpaB/mpaB'/Rubber oxygenase catalytic domain-containing protein n=1 Tax=Rhodotorula paludigena TaxID=86838 RepID=A0AAV5G4Z5_9BASI|nr:hypothetical protein Rhopal_000495-T1 [Rhodotorula paludigena]
MGLLRPDPLLVIGPPLSPEQRAAPVQLPPAHPDPAGFINELESGAVFRHFDFLAVFDEKTSLRPRDIEPLRRVGDPLADQAVDILGLAEVQGRGKDALKAIEEYLEEKERDLGAERWEEVRKEDAVARLWDEMRNEPPEGVRGYAADAAGKEDRRATPYEPFEATDGAPSLAEGQAVFWRYSAQIYSALGHFSLAGGFSAPKLAAVMHETNYLTSNARDATHKRLLETSLFVIDVRRRIAKGKGRYNKYDEEENGVPINQADLLAVLGAFMIAPMWSLRRIGVKVTPREEEAYQVCWRHIGYYLGIDPELLVRLYGQSFYTAETYFASLAFSIFPSGAPPPDPLATPQYKILSAISQRPPAPQNIGHHIELCRLLLGPSLADQLALPHGSWKDRFSVDLEIGIGKALLFFGDAYSHTRVPFLGRRGKDWEKRRQAWFRRVIELVVVYHLGERRTVFAWRETDKHQLKLDDVEGEEPGIEMGPHIGVAVRTEWRNLLIEMGCVLGGAAVAVGATSSERPSERVQLNSAPSGVVSSNLREAGSSRLACSPRPPPGVSDSAMTQWRASPSRPAPPVTSAQSDGPSDSFDSLFAASSSSSRSSRPSSSSATFSSPGRTLSSASSAYSLLSKKMAEFDEEDDRSSIRSGISARSGMTLSSRPGGSATAGGVLGEGTGEDFEPMSLDDEAKPTAAGGKGKEAEVMSSSAPTKRQRLRAPSVLGPGDRPPRRRSTFGAAANNPGSVASPPQPTLSTTTAEQLMPSMRKKPDRAMSTASASTSTASLARPASTASASTPRSSRSPSLRKSTSRPLASTSPSPALSSSPSDSLAQRRKTTQPAALDGVESMPSRGWLSMLSRSKSSAVDLASQTREEPAVGSSGDRMLVDEPEQEGEEDAGEATPPATPRAARPAMVTGLSADDSTLRGSPAPLAPDSSALPPDRSTLNSRSSWFGWGWGGAPSEPATAPLAADESAPSSDVSGTASATTATPSADESAQPDFESALTPPAPATEAQTRGSGWLSAFWGASGTAPSAEQLAEQRRREVWALKLAAKQAGANKLIEAAQPESEACTVPTPQGRSDTAGEQAKDSTAVEPSTPAQQIKHRPSSSSWSLFSRTPGSISSLRAPLAGLGMSSSSAASTRSRTSSHAGADTAPSSPQLRAQSDQGQVKPLTGSMRPSSRQRSHPSFDPPPPVDNLVLPTFGDTFLRPPRSFPPKKSTLTRAVSAVSAYLFHRPPEEVTSPRLLQAQQAAGSIAAGLPTEMKDDPAERLPKMLEVMGEEPRLQKIKRVTVLGVHGWFTSSNMVKSVMGEQTGTSVKFATMMHDAVQSYLESQDVGSFNIQAIALEGGGQVEDRVSKLYNQLVGREEWVQALKMADAVFLATHSQGVVVSTQLIARMLDQGLIAGPQTHLCVSGEVASLIYLYNSIALAPYFNYVESAPARELFEYQNPESVSAIKFLEALRLILNAGVKVTSVGSINDQVVPLYSALFSGVSHPGILRAVYIDSDAFRTSDFLANLVVFSARLRNAGLSDHDLVYHVSEALAGALTGVGHSTIYEEEDVYRLAVRYHFETTSLTEAPTALDTLASPPPLSMSFNPRDRRNPYLLTWALRGIIEDPQVRELFSNELAALREAYETWKPQTKVLKDVKLKLEGIRLMHTRPGKL